MRDAVGEVRRGHAVHTTVSEHRGGSVSALELATSGGRGGGQNVHWPRSPLVLLPSESLKAYACINVTKTGQIGGRTDTRTVALRFFSTNAAIIRYKKFVTLHICHKRSVNDKPVISILAGFCFVLHCN